MLISRKQIGRFRHQFLTPLGALAWLFFLRGKTKKGLPNIWTETENRGGPIREARKVYTAAGEEGGREGGKLLAYMHHRTYIHSLFFGNSARGETSHRFFFKKSVPLSAWFTRTHFTLRLLCPGEKRVRRVAESSSPVCVCFVYRQLPIKQPAAAAAAAAAAASPRDSGGGGKN